MIYLLHVLLRLATINKSHMSKAHKRNQTGYVVARSIVSTALWTGTRRRR